MDIINWDGLIALLLAPFVWLLDGLILVIGLTSYYILDGFMIVSIAIFSSLDLSTTTFDYAATIMGLPTQLKFLLDAVGFPQCLMILSSAYIAKFIISKIPLKELLALL
jgi:hypothetical protein